MNLRPLLLLAALAPVSAFAAAPAVMPVTGFLTDNAGAPLDGTYDLTVKLYRTPTGGPVAWTSDIQVDVVDGQFTAYLGEDTALDLALFADGNAPTYLGMAVEGGAEMAPRFELGTVPYAAFAQFADFADMAGESETSVYAESAGSADTALSADHADTADTALNADHADNADNALTADNALSADVADNALDADHADTCDNATKLGGFAVTAFRKTSDQISWSDLNPATVPAGLSDGDDDTSTVYTAGTGLSLAGTQFSADKAAIEGWARGVAYDTLTELRGALDAVYMAKQTCATNEVLAADGSGGWLCKSTTTLPLSETAVDALVANNGYATATNLTTLSNTVTTLSTTVSGHTTSISGLTTDVGDLDTRVTAVESAISGLNSSPGNMLGRWQFDDNTGATTFADTSGLGNDLKATSGAIGAGVVTGAHAGKMVNFQGIEGMSIASGNTMADVDQIWVETWMKSGDVTGTYTLVDKQGAYKMRMTGSKVEWTVTTQGSSTACTVTHPSVLTNNTWTHVAGWYDGLTVVVAVNGYQVAATCNTGRVAPTVGNVFTVGGKLTGTSWSEVFSGNLDELRVRPTAPSPSGNYIYQATTANLPIYRYSNTMGTYKDGGAASWVWNNDATLFCGVNPSNITDGNYTPANMSSDKNCWRSLLVNVGRGGSNAVIKNESKYYYYSSTDGPITWVMFRIRNNTSSNINWTPYFWTTYYASWAERAAVTLNGTNVWTSAGSDCNAYTCANSVTMTIPANRTSSVIFQASGGYPWNAERSHVLAFYNNSLTLPTGLVYVDDFDVMTGDWSQ